MIAGSIRFLNLKRRMKRFFAFAICLLSLQIVKAHTLVIADSAIQKEAVYNSSQKSFRDTVAASIINQTPLPGYYQNSIYKLRLDSIQKDIPLDYNEYVQAYIDTYTRHRDEMAHVLGLAKYYFPIYEKIFHDAGIPEEIKYLSIVESKLDPNAVSRVGATGPWQFMSTTAKMYGLNMDGYIDERRDPIQASYAAAAYLKDAYIEFGDWLLAIASYNCGKSNVEQAIAKAGANDFWSIRQYLPIETRGYVPAYIAVAYVMNYANKHNITAQPWGLSAHVDTVLVNRSVSLSNISRALKIDASELALLNPAYRQQIINGTAIAPRRLVIPKTTSENYAALYDALNNAGSPVIQPQVTNMLYNAVPERRMPDFHKVRRGETLGDIADMYGVELQDLKDWNHLHGNKATVGKKLWLSAGHDSGSEDIAAKKHSSKYVMYKVKHGDTLNTIADKFDGVSIENIRLLNGLKSGPLQPGMTLKINCG